MEHAEHKHDDGDVHVHIHSWKLYLGILLGLLFLTFITIAASWVDIDGILSMGREVQGVGAWNLLVALLIASTKATLVVLFFMHLKDDSRFNAIVFIGSLLFIGVFFAYTMNDTAVRGTMDRYNGVHVDPDTGLRAPGGIPAPIHGERLEEGMPEPAAPAAAPAAGHEPASPAPAEEAPPEDTGAVLEGAAPQEEALPAPSEAAVPEAPAGAEAPVEEPAPEAPPVE